MPTLSKRSFANALPRGLAYALVASAASVAVGCSDSSGAPATSSDASATEASVVDGQAGPPPPLGVPIASTRCASCNVCGGVLGSPTTGIAYCTQDCTTDADCPSGLGCVAALSTASLSNECIKKCASSSDCTAPFICRSDLPTPGSFCWSPYPPPKDAGPPAIDAGSDAGPSGSTDAGDAGPADAGPGDAATDAIADAPAE
jgi:hypothetical protein